MPQLNSLLTDTELLALSERRYRRLRKAYKYQNDLVVDAQLNNIKLAIENAALVKKLSEVVPDEAK